jgi:sporulation protein YlmC with PRC-barrel domain
MKKKIRVTSLLVAIVSGTIYIWPQPATADDSLREHAVTRNSQYHWLSLEKVTRVVGAEIKDAKNQKLGKIKDLAIDLQNGRIVEVIVSTGGVLGIDEQLIAVPPQQFSWDANTKNFQMNLDRTQFKAAPRFKMSEWESNVHEASVGEVYRYYSEQPYFDADGTRQPSAPTNHLDKTQLATGASQNEQSARDVAAMPAHLGEVLRASKLIGTTTCNTQNEKLGRIENLVVDLPAGRVAEVIIATGGFLGLGDELSAVPPQSFHAGIHPDTLTLDTTRQELANAPRFKRAQWKVNDSEQVETVYRTYHVEPYFATNAVDNTAQNVRDRAGVSPTPLDQGTSSSDISITRGIRKQVTDLPGLSVNARNVKIITRDGRVTLRGPVNTEEEKREIADIAMKATSSAEVDDQLEVADTAPASSPK